MYPKTPYIIILAKVSYKNMKLLQMLFICSV